MSDAPLKSTTPSPARREEFALPRPVARNTSVLRAHVETKNRLEPIPGHSSGFNSTPKSNTLGMGRAIVPTKMQRKRRQRIAVAVGADYGYIMEHHRTARPLPWHKKALRQMRRFAESPGGVLISASMIAISLGLAPAVALNSAPEPAPHIVVESSEPVGVHQMPKGN